MSTGGANISIKQKNPQWSFNVPDHRKGKPCLSAMQSKTVVSLLPLMLLILNCWLDYTIDRTVDRVEKLGGRGEWREKGATSWTQSWSNLYACPLHFTASYFFSSSSYEVCCNTCFVFLCCLGLISYLLMHFVFLIFCYIYILLHLNSPVFYFADS